MKFGSAMVSPRNNLSWAIKNFEAKIPYSATLPYLLKLSVNQPFSAVSGQILYARVCFQDIHMKANGFLNLMFKHIASHLLEKTVATHCAAPLSALPTPVKNIYSVLFHLVCLVYFFVSTYKFLSLHV